MYTPRSPEEIASFERLLFEKFDGDRRKAETNPMVAFLRRLGFDYSEDHTSMGWVVYRRTRPVVHIAIDTLSGHWRVQKGHSVDGELRPVTTERDFVKLLESTYAEPWFRKHKLSLLLTP